MITTEQNLNNIIFYSQLPFQERLRIMIYLIQSNNGEILLSRKSKLIYQDHSTLDDYLPSASKSILSVEKTSSSSSHDQMLVNAIEKRDRYLKIITYILNVLNEILSVDDLQIFYYLYILKYTTSQTVHYTGYSINKIIYSRNRIRESIQEYLFL